MSEPTVGDSDLHATLDSLGDALQRAFEWLELTAGKTHSFRIVSAIEIREKAIEIGKWQSSQQSAGAPELSSLQRRAAIYSLGETASEMRAYCAVSSCVCLDLIEVALPLLRRRKIGIAFTMIRGLIERMAVAAALIQNISSKLVASLQTREQAFRNVLELGEYTNVTLHGTRVNWRKLVDHQMTSIRPKDARYRPEEFRIDRSAKQILNSIDILDKRIPGTRVAYEVLCEFLHPNVGDLIATTIASGAIPDSFGTRHLELVIGRGPMDLSNTPDLQSVLTKTGNIAVNIVQKIQPLFGELHRQSDEITMRTRKMMRTLIKKNRQAFRRNDLCPCHSGLTVGNCCYRVA